MKFRKVRLCDLCSIVTDYVANGSFKTLADKVKYLNEGYARVIRLVDYNNKYSKKDSIWVSKESYEFLKKSKLYGGEIVLTNVGANLGTVFIAPQFEYPTTLGPNAIMIKTNENDKYLYYWLKSKNGQNTIKSIVTGSAMPKFNKTDLKNIEIAIPCIEDQDKIVEILSNIDKKIELNNQTNESFKDVFVTAPTGAGKSILFQVPAIVAAEKNELLTIVISPLIGLMKDQVNNIKLLTNCAATINSEFTPIEKEKIIEDIQNKKVSILYISPETLLSNANIETFIGDRQIGLLVVDEAHTVSTWGKNFRPDYWYLGDYLDKLRHRTKLFFQLQHLQPQQQLVMVQKICIMI